MYEIQVFFHDQLNPQVGAMARLNYKGRALLSLEVEWAGHELATLQAGSEALVGVMADPGNDVLEVYRGEEIRRSAAGHEDTDGQRHPSLIGIRRMIDARMDGPGRGD